MPFQSFFNDGLIFSKSFWRTFSTPRTGRPGLPRVFLRGRTGRSGRTPTSVLPRQGGGSYLVQAI